uniref:Sulfatase N-terminal domain-containing protein n=1 Tax=Oncorhynchus tshawytscha TaxID=74940 RepID=A0A8C8M7Y4_ONCTS
MCYHVITAIDVCPIQTLILFCSLICRIWADNPSNKSTPSIVIILMDDMGWGDVGVFGQPSETPNLDSMVAQGMLFPNFYTANPLCSPCQCHLHTSYTPQEIVGGISKDKILLPQVLKKKGYVNKIIGKCDNSNSVFLLPPSFFPGLRHPGHIAHHLPLEHGFDEWCGAPNCHFGPYNSSDRPNVPVYNNSQMVGRYTHTLQHSFPHSHRTENIKILSPGLFQCLARLVAPLNEDIFFTPLLCTSCVQYGDSVMELDYVVGQILAWLRALGIEKDTFVFFTSNNGAAVMSGPKQSGSNGGMREPAVTWWPKHIPAGTVSQQLGTVVDLFSTSLSVAGFSVPDDSLIDGLDLSPVLHNNTLINRPIFYYHGNERVGPYKAHYWTWSNSWEEFNQGINFCPGQEMAGVTTHTQQEHTMQPLIFHLGQVPWEKCSLKHTKIPWCTEYQDALSRITAVVEKHKKGLVPGVPQLNMCDMAVMKIGTPPGCEKLGKCLKAPKSQPWKCDWPH